MYTRHLLKKIDIANIVIHARNFSLGINVCAASASPLATLRKETGFSISHCKKALQINDSNIEEAKKWLDKEAQSHGWAKATTLAGRVTTQGLIGVHVKDNVGTLVEVNCETDFVARNQDFQSLVANIAKNCTYSLPNQSNFSKEFLNNEQISALKDTNGNNYSDVIAMAIGKIGEKISLKRAIRVTGGSDVQLVSHTHPSSSNDSVKLGKFAVITAFDKVTDETLAKDMCVHIIGMNPTEIGSYEEDFLAENTEEILETAKPKSTEEGVEEHQETDEEHQETIEVKDESVLLHQSFMNDPDVKVGRLLQENQMKIIDFVRIQVGVVH